jgi:hypothetical protein
MTPGGALPVLVTVAVDAIELGHQVGWELSIRHIADGFGAYIALSTQALHRIVE